MVHDGEFLEGCRFEVADGDELGVTLDGRFGEDETAFRGYRLAGVVFYRDTLVDTTIRCDTLRARDTQGRR